MRTVLLLVGLAALVSAKANDDPELKMDALQLINHWGYVGEQHAVVTADEYKLNIFRIPYGKSGPGKDKGPRPVVFLQHGLECSCTNWLTNLPCESAAFIFADAGFDVWLGNFRGNTYASEKFNSHMSKREFWDFSYDEMAKYDLPAMLDYALGKSGASCLYYMGHSEGTMTPFALLSSTHDYDHKICKVFALGPVASVHHIGGFLGAIKKLGIPLGDLLKFLGVGQFLPSNWITHEAAKIICENAELDKAVCENILFLIAGPDTTQLNATRVPIFISHTPAGTSVKNVLHFVQGTTTDAFQMYDYGELGNLARYHQSKPPQYDLTQINVPVYLYIGNKDVLADPTDVRNVIIPNIPTIKETNWFNFNHLDFIWGLQAAPQVYAKVIRTIAADGVNVTVPACVGAGL